LFTVLIAEKEHIDAIRQENKLFFEPFLENKELAFCYWNPEGQSLLDSVPGLYDAVGRQKNWRAVIINNAKEPMIKTQNPFDIVDYSPVTNLTMPERQLKSEEDDKEKTDKEAAHEARMVAYREWETSWKDYFADLTKAKETVFKSALEYPLQKLSTWLCFRPEDYILNDVREKQDSQDWAMEQLGRDTQKASLQLEQMEREQYKLELRMKELFRREFIGDSYLDIAYPKELHCVSIRTADKSFFRPDDYWNVKRECDYSAFADRNMYFDKMRFMVFDLLPQTHRDFRTDYIRFLAAMLLLASNPVPGSAMQARHLYRMETETDETPLCTLITSYDKKLAATSEMIEAEMERIRSEIPGEMTDKVAEALFCSPKDIAVVLEASGEMEKAFADMNYGLFYDSPENEYSKWDRSYQRSGRALTYLSKQQARAIRKSVGQMHLSGAVTDVNINRLTPYQMEDVREYTDAEEDEMVASIPPDLTDISRYTDRMEEECKNVKKVLEQRMTRKTTFILGGVCMGVYLMCFLPFLFGNLFTKFSTALTGSTAIMFSAVMLAMLAGVMFVTLFILRLPVIKAVKKYNSVVHEILTDIQSAMTRFSKYLSASGNVRRGHAIQNFAQKNIDEYTKGLRIRRKHLEDIRKKRAYLSEEYKDYYGDKSYCDEVMSRPYAYDFGQQTEYVYSAPFLAGDCRQIEFMSSGNYVTAPSSYMMRLLVRMEGIYEDW